MKGVSQLFKIEKGDQWQIPLIYFNKYIGKLKTMKFMISLFYFNYTKNKKFSVHSRYSFGLGKKNPDTLKILVRNFLRKEKSSWINLFSCKVKAECLDEKFMLVACWKICEFIFCCLLFLRKLSRGKFGRQFMKEWKIEHGVVIEWRIIKIFEDWSSGLEHDLSI